MPHPWDYYAGMDQRFEYAEKLAGKARFYSDDQRKALVESIAYGFDLTAHPDGTLTAVRYLNQPSGPWMRQLRVGGRGHGKIRAQIEALRKWNSRPEAFIAHKAPDIGEVRWSCPKPTDPVYPIGSRGWMITQYEASLIDKMAEDNRKLNPRMAAKVSAVQEILGVKPSGSNDPQVP